MDKIADTLRIEVLGDSSDAISGIEKLIATLERIKGVTSGSNKGLNSSQKCLDKLAEVADKIDSGSITKIYKLANGLKTLNEVGNLKLSSKTADRIWDLGVAVDSLKGVDMSKLTELATGLSALGGVGNVSIPKGLGSIANTNAKAPVSSAFGEDVRIDPSTVTDTSDRLDGLNAKISESGSRWSSYANTATKALSNVKSGTAKLGSVAGKVFSNLTSKLSKNVRLVQLQILYRVVDRILSLITSSFKEGIDAVYQYSKALGGSFAKSLDTLAASFNYLKGSLGAMAAPLIVTLTPVIEWLIDKFVDLLNIINQVFARLSGASTWTKATKVATEYAAAADDATAANKRLKKSLLGIDEINALQDNSTNDGGGSSSTNDNAGYAFTEVPLDNTYVDGIIDRLKEILTIVGEIGIGLLAWKLSAPFLGSLNALSVALGATLLIDAIRCVLKDGLDIGDIVKGAIGGALIGAGLGFKFGGWMGAIGGIIIGVGVSLLIEGITSMISEGFNVENAITTLSGALGTVTGIATVIKLFNKKVGNPTTEMDTAAQNLETVSTGTSTITTKLTTLVKNLALGIVIIAEVAVAAGLIVASIWGLAVLLEQVGKSWQPVIDNGGTVAIAMGVGVGILASIGATTALLGSVGTPLIVKIALGTAILAELGVATGLFIAEIWAIGLGLDQIGIAWQPVLNNGENIAIAIGIGTGLLIGIGVVAAALGVATVASAGLLPLAIGLGTALLVELAAAFIEFCDSLIDVALKLTDLAPPLDNLNSILPDLRTDMDSFTAFMKDFANAVVQFTKANAIAGIAATIDTVISFFTTDPINRMHNEVNDQIDEFEDLIPALEKINPMIEKATKLVGVYKANMGSFESATGGSGGFLNSIVNGAKGVVNGLIGLFEGMANGVIKCINFLIKGLNKISFSVPDWVPGIGGKTFGFNISPISEVTIPRLADGGIVNAGQMFIARESGAELVGNIGRQTAVMNNDQIVESVSQGVADANAEQNALLREEINILRKILDKDVPYSPYGGARSTVSDIVRRNRRDGKTVIPVGV